MQQLDWVGEPERRKFKDIRNTRDTIAEEKARLCLLIGEAMNKVPPKLKSGGSVNDVRSWRSDRAEVEKVVKSKRSSIHELEAALNKMRRWA